MHSRSLSYGIAVLTIALALLLKLLLDHLIQPESMLLLFFAAVVVSAYCGGWKSGVLATGLAALSSLYFLLSSTDESWRHSLIHHLQLVVFVFQGGLISALMGALHKAKQTAEISVAQLQERGELLRQLTENIREVFWVFSPENNKMLYVSSAYEEIWGRSCTQLYEQPLSFLDSIHPEDRERVIVARNKEVQGGYDEEYRIIRSDGAVRWIRSRAFPICNSLGQVYRLAGISEDITESRRAQTELRRINERFQLAAIAANCIIYDWDIQQNTVDRAQGFTQLLGYAPHEVEQSNGWWRECIHPDDRERANTEVWEALANPEVSRFEIEYRVRHKQGSYLYVCDRGIITRNSSGQAVRVVGCSLDMSDRKRIQEERQRLLDQLEKSLGQLEAVVSSMTEGLIISDPQGNVLTMNPAALRFHEFQNVEQVHRHLREFSDIFELYDLDGNLIPIEEWPLARALRGETFHDCEIQVRRVDTSTVWIGNFGGTPVRNKQEQLILAIITMRDVTEKKRSQKELAHSLEREQAARAESEAARSAAEAANRIKDEFLAVLSHELRSPLNPILGWSKLLRTGKLDEATTARALETIERNAKLQTQLIEDLLDVSRILRGKLSLNVSPVNLSSTIEAAMETVRLAAQAKSIQIQTVFEPTVGSVSGDASRLQQVVWNLLSNAIKFTPEGGRVEVRLSAVKGLQVSKLKSWKVDQGLLASRRSSYEDVIQVRRLNVDSSTQTNLQLATSYAQLQVTDTGKGINPEFLPYVFDYFRQESSATTRAFGGLGLGLAIVRHLVELHGGTVWAESPGEGQGATFTVSLPMMTVSPQMNQDNNQLDSPPDLSGIRILAVDDEADMRDFLIFMLKRYGASITAVASAAEALEALGQVKPDLLLSDIGIPDMDGYTLIRQIRAMPPEQGGQIRAIALTAYATEADHQQALSAGFQMHVTKPVEPIVLAKAIANLMGEPGNV